MQLLRKFSPAILLVFLLFLTGCAGSSGLQNESDEVSINKGINAYHRGDYATALNNLKPLAEQGHVDAQKMLGWLYQNGYGVIQNYKAAMKWYKLAAEQGDAAAHSNLGAMYGDGLGVTQDNIRAYMWWHIAASQGIEDAKWNLKKVRREMKSTDETKAQNLARECVAKNYKNC